MAMQNLLTGTGPSMTEMPDTPLRALAPGNLQKMSAEHRGKVLKRKKRITPPPSLVTPVTVPGAE